MRVLLASVLILLAITSLQVAIFLRLLRRWRTQAEGFVTDFLALAEASGERIVAGPDKAVYRGGSKPYSAVKGNGTMILTDRRLVFRKLTGGMVEVPRSAITEVRQEKGFRGSRVGGMTHLVVNTTDPAELGFFVPDLPAWQQALEARP